MSAVWMSAVLEHGHELRQVVEAREARAGAVARALGDSLSRWFVAAKKKFMNANAYDRLTGFHSTSQFCENA
jgi:hypothetical protein